MQARTDACLNFLFAEFFQTGMALRAAYFQITICLPSFQVASNIFLCWFVLRFRGMFFLYAIN